MGNQFGNNKRKDINNDFILQKKINYNNKKGNIKKNKKKKKEEKDLDSFYLQDQNINKKNKKNKKNINESEEDLRKIDIDRIGSKFDNALKKKKMENSRKKQ